MSAQSTQPFTATHLTNALKGLAACHANGESAEGLIVEVETYMLHFIEQSSDMVSTCMSTVLLAKIHLPSAVLEGLYTLSLDEGHAPATAMMSPTATSVPAITSALGWTRTASKRVHKEAVLPEKAVEDDTQPKPHGCGRPKGTTKVQYGEVQTACRGCMEQKLQCHVPISGQAEVGEECAQKKTWCSFADGRGLRAESSEEVEEVNEALVGQQWSGPKKPQLIMEDITSKC
ncbi:hypothetical protein GLOTRDRAFT_134054 [Gloeophyllum trabeum ATCC 11539]|uniref:Uncharacterized protein n=1 Tax=Gloeophyllum trabeum (strain ATCC 11539 / FP-39264 / Madison 617) TaxID=670483 RepID=S7PSC5_GLOTA|nr:uncharacterized protein GLOTRDRAFT_134054 [Gloeophyllum trabeum ATCC 11539]EPQ50313.1 hypothetical protein GLOTRDRAFT_134054 [Gloeophyllum trabeum ATCC 11539]